MTTSTIVIHKFWTNYIPDPADPAKLISVDWVSYGPLGGHDRSVTIDRVSRLLNRLVPLEGNNNPAVAMAHERAAMIEKHYKAWKAGQEVPTEGTPLAAWNAISPEAAELFKSRGVRTVEEIAGLSDSHIAKFPIPNLRDLLKQAKGFLASADQNRFSAQLSEKDRQIVALQEESAERDAQIRDLMQKVDALAEMAAAAKDEPAAAASRKSK